MHKTEIDGQSVKLREITASDAELIVSWRSLPRIYERLFDARPITLKSHMRWFEQNYLKDETRTDYIIIEKGSGLPAGVAGIKTSPEFAELSYMIGEEAMTGRGLAKDAVRTLMMYAKELGYSLATARILDDNPASIGLVLSLGFKRLRAVETERPASVYGAEL